MSSTENLIVAAIILPPQTQLTPAIKEMFVDATTGNVCTNRNPRQSISTGIDGSISISLQFTVGFANLPPQISVTLLEPGVPLKLVKPLMPHPVASV